MGHPEGPAPHGFGAGLAVPGPERVPTLCITDFTPPRGQIVSAGEVN